MVTLLFSRENRRSYGLTLYDDIYRLPENIAKLVGDITARFAFLEFSLKEIVRKLTELDPKVGRVSIRQPRIGEFIDMLQEVLEIEQITVATDLNKLKKRIEDVKNYRDMIAHTLWQRHPETKALYARRLTGRWPKKHLRHPGMSRRIVPQPVLVTPPLMRAQRKELNSLIADVRKLDRSLSVALRALRKRLCEQLLERHGHRDQRGKKRLIRLTPSRG